VFGPEDRLASFGDGKRLGLCELSTATESRTLSGHTAAKGPHSVDFSPDGLWLVSAADDGVRVWAASTGKECAHLELKAFSTAFCPDGRTLITSGQSGLWRWPIRTTGEWNTGDWTIGPPQRLYRGATTDLRRATLTPDGKTLAVADRGQGEALLLNLEEPDDGILLKGIPDILNVAVSPDGQWVATSTWQRAEVKVWSAKTGEFVQELPVMSWSEAVFSPDSKSLIAATSGGCLVWEVGTWQPRPPIETDGQDIRVRHIEFSHDGKLAALARWDGVLQLIEWDTRRHLANLSPPDPRILTWVTFSPDDSHLATASENRVVQLWDLGQVRRQLRDIGLDWGQANDDGLSESMYTFNSKPQESGLDSAHDSDTEQARAMGLPLDEPTADQGDELRTSRVRVLLGELEPAACEQRAARAIVSREYDKAIVLCERILELTPDNPKACNNLAWIYATGPARLRDADKSLQFAQRAVELTPHEWMYLNTLGVAYYRAGQLERAVDTLLRSSADRKNRAIAFDLFFLAMSYHQLGKGEEAKVHYQRAVQWWESQRDLPAAWIEELKVIRTEAEGVLSTRVGP
jgi:WD40 repeat protein